MRGDGCIAVARSAACPRHFYGKVGAFSSTCRDTSNWLGSPADACGARMRAGRRAPSVAMSASSLSPERLAEIAREQDRINCEAVVKGARENPLTLTPRYVESERRTVPLADDGRTRIRRAAEVAAAIPRSSWALRPYLERDAVAVLYGDFGTYKSFVALDWALRVALGLPALGHPWPAASGPVIFISAEGRGLAQRLRGWCIRNFPGETYAAVLARAPLHCIEHPVNLSDLGCARALVARIAQLGIAPVCVVIDTMTRNSDGRIENSTADAATYLAIVDQELRAHFRCAVLLTHHVGHTEKGRIRGPIVIAANTDALIRIERPDPDQRVAMLTVERLKDSDPLPPQALRASVVEVGVQDEDGQEITTLALEACESIAPELERSFAVPRGKAQRQLLKALRAQDDATAIRTIADIREIGRKAGLSKGTAWSAAESLTLSPHMVPTVGGWRLADV
jgi:AAA domain